MDNLILKYQKHIQGLCDVGCNLFDVRLKEFIYSDTYYCKNCEKPCSYNSTHLYGCYEAERWGNKYIYYCPRGFIYIAISGLNNFDLSSLAVITGPIIMGDPSDFDDNKITNMSTKRVNDLTELLHGIFTNLNSQNEPNHKEEFLNDIYKVIYESKVVASYPMELEKEFQNAIIAGDTKESKELLNKLLGYIFFSSNSDFEIIKLRVTELIVLISRSAIEGGGDANEIFGLNSGYMKEVEKFKDLESLSMWLSGILNKFIGYVFEFKDIKHTDTIYKATAYIKENYMNKLNLDEIANHVYLNKSYLSKIFKEEMNISLSNYINKVRVDKSKILLLDNSLSLVDVSNLVGFLDQSYYTKVFKKLIGVSPGKYREKHGKLK